MGIQNRPLSSVHADSLGNLITTRTYTEKQAYRKLAPLAEWPGTQSQNLLMQTSESWLCQQRTQGILSFSLHTEARALASS